MSKEELNELYTLLIKLQKDSICNGGPCPGYQHCDFGIDCCDGGRCSIEYVQDVISMIIFDKEHGKQ